jgi:hypothetical protein
LARKLPKKPKVIKTVKKTVRRSAPKKSKEFLRRSEAAKLGHKCRRDKAKIEALKKAVRSEAAKRGHQKRKQTPATSDKARIAELERELASQKEAAAKAADEASKAADRALAAIKEMENQRQWEHDQLAMIRSDGSAAKQPSILRHVDDAQSLYDRLVAADAKGTLDAEARKIRKEQDVSIQEVYTLFYSP